MMGGVSKLHAKGHGYRRPLFGQSMQLVSLTGGKLSSGKQGFIVDKLLLASNSETIAP